MSQFENNTNCFFLKLIVYTQKVLKDTKNDFDNQGLKILTKCQKNFPLMTKNWWWKDFVCFSENDYFSAKLLGRRRMQFWQPHRKLSNKCLKLSVQGQALLKKPFFYKEILPLKRSHRHIPCEFDNSAGSILAWCRKCPQLIKNLTPQNEIFLDKTFVWTRRMQFVQFGWKSFNIRPKVFGSMFK